MSWRATRRDVPYRRLRQFPVATSRTNQRRSNRTPSQDPPLNTLQSDALEAIWQSLVNGVDATHGVSDINVEVFEAVKAFCRTSHEASTEILPLGALFTGSLVQCHAVEPLKLLAAVLREAAFDVATVDPMQHRAVSTLIEAALEQRRLLKTDTPQVILIEVVETLDSRVFSDLLSLLLRYRAEFRVTLLIGVSSTTRLDALIPVQYRSRLESRSFALMSPRQCFEKLLEKMLLSADSPGILLGRPVMEVLNNLYLYHHFTVASFQENLRQALLDHISHDPFGSLIQYMGPQCFDNEAIKRALEGLPEGFWGVMSPVRVEALPEVMKNALEQVAGWKTCLLWLHLIAELVGSVTRGAGHSLRELYYNALHRNFLQSYTIPKVEAWVAEEEKALEKASAVSEALQRLCQIAEDFGKCNLYLRGVIPRLQQLQEELKQSQDSSSSSKKKKRHRASKKLHPMLIKTSHELDVIVERLVRMYCTESPADLPGKQIYCLSRDHFMRTHLHAAPRLELPTLLQDPVEVSDAHQLLKDAAVLYQLCLDKTGSELGVLDGFIAFAGRYRVTIPTKPTPSAENPRLTFSPDSQDNAENHVPALAELRRRFEWAVRSLEELGLMRRFRRGEHVRLRLEVFND